jgi:hypothetical protein
VSWTKDDYIRNWPDGPNPYSSSDAPCRNGQLVNDADVLNAMAAHQAMMARCTCDWDINDAGNGVNTPPATGCPVHDEEEDPDAPCQSCNGTGVKTDANGIQSDDVCPDCEAA